MDPPLFSVLFILKFFQQFAISETSFPIKTSWPLKHGFVGSAITNLNNFLNSFSGCLIHVYNYQGIDFLPLNEPIVLTRIDVFGIWGEEHLERELCPMAIEKTPELKHIPKNFTRSKSCYAHVIDRSTTARWHCEAKFDLFLPELEDAKHYYHAYYDYHIVTFEGHTQLITSRQSLSFGAGTIKLHEDIPTSMFIRETYFIHIGLPNCTSDALHFWQILNSRSFLNTNTFHQVHLSTNPLIISQSPVEQRYLKISSVKYLCPVCNLNEARNLSEESQNLDFVVSIQRAVNSNIHPHRWELLIVSKIFEQIIEEYPVFNATSFLHLDSLKNSLSSLYLTFELLTCVTRNKTVGMRLPDKLNRYNKAISYSHLLEQGALRTQISSVASNAKFGTHIFPLSRLTYSFVACSKPFQLGISLSGLLKAFDFHTWILISLFMFVCPFLMSLTTENDMKVSKIIKEVDILFLGFFLLIEQCHMRNVNRFQKGPLITLYSSILLVAIVLSNAYKGENINDITKSLIPEAYSNFDQLINNKVEIFGKCYAIGIPYAFYLFNKSISEMEYESKKNLLSIDQNKFRSVIKSMKIWPLPDGGDVKEVVKDYLTMNVSKEVFGSCDGRAWLGWNRDLESLKEELDIKYPGRVFTGKEILFYNTLGWKLSKYRDQKVVSRILWLESNGIFGFWQNLLRFKERDKASNREAYTGVSLNTSMVGIFYILLIGCFVSKILFLVEYGPRRVLLWAFRFISGQLNSLKKMACSCFDSLKENQNM